ncbi:MAG: sulfatase-like hydrolase/transferase, partial [Pseudomonadales bacterium]|nr:sulfatase-like hydrolase/transferase [Pseudomonadales bacterium]
MNLIKINLLILIFLLTLSSVCKGQKPNVIIIYTDDQGYGDVSALNPQAKFATPNIDRLVNEGLTFTDAHTSSTVCTPSRYGLLTGRYSWRTSLKRGVIGADGDCLIPNDRLTLASLMKQNGYLTAIIGKWHLNMQFPGTKGKRDWSEPITDGPIEKGFDYYFGLPASMNYGLLTYIENDRVLEIPSKWTRKKIVQEPYWNEKPESYRMMPPYDNNQQMERDIEVAPSFRDDEVLLNFTNKAVDYINKVSNSAKNGKPFFLYFPLTSPHLPHSVHPDFEGRGDCGTYGAFMEETDYRVGQILEVLDANNLASNTVVIFSSDNGAETNYKDHVKVFQHYSSLHFRGGKRDLFEGGHRIPFIVRWP